MAKLKKYLLYVFLIAAFWIFSDILIYLSINTTYAHVDTKVLAVSPEITVGQSKATYVNGFIKGNIKNNTDAIIKDKYLKIDLYSPRDVKMGTKYVKIENLDINNTQQFEMWYKFTDIDHIEITITDNIEKVTEEELLSEEASTILIFGTILVLYFM